MGAVEAGRRWHREQQLRFPPNANKAFSRATSISCTTAGTCLGVGLYSDTGGRLRAMSVTEANGHWAAAFLRLPANAATGSQQRSGLNSVACAQTGQCTAAGFYADTIGGFRADAATSPANR